MLRDTLQESVEILAGREEYWRRRMDREVEKRRLHFEKHMPTTPVPGLFISGARFGPGKAHQRSHSHGGQVLFNSHSPTQVMQHPPLLGLPPHNKHPIDGPDFQDGPNFCISEEHFYDAIDAQIDKIHSERIIKFSSRSIEMSWYLHDKKKELKVVDLNKLFHLG